MTPSSLHADELAEIQVADLTYKPLKPELDREQLEADGAMIGTITIESENIFDLDNPLEDKSLYRLANRLHSVTKPDVIRSQLLFKEGDAYSIRVADETERNLRGNAYLHEANVEPVRYEDGVVDLRIWTKDVWTLTPSLSLGRSGGENRFGVGIAEQNLFGNGVQLGLKYKSDVDRDQLRLDYINNHVNGTRNRLRGRVANNSDGHEYIFGFDKPFFALDSKRSAGMLLANVERDVPLYELGEEVSNFHQALAHHEVFAGWSKGLQNGWVRRYTAGVVYDDNIFTPTPETIDPVTLVPDDRRYLYPFIGFEVLEDHYEKGVNFDQIRRTEDRFLGTRFAFRLGYASTAVGSSSDSWHYSGGYSNAFITTEKTSLVMGADLSGRYENGENNNMELNAVARFHRRTSKNQLFYASLSGTVGHNLDLDNQLLLGGDTGLRGYPLRYQGGDKKLLLTLEQRLFTEWYPFRLAYVGAVVFFDAGRTWGENPVGGPNLGLLKDVGVGLRLGSTRSSKARVLHIDLAFPLDGGEDIDSVQILLDAKSSF